MTPDELSAKLKELEQLVDSGKITMLDYNERRTALIKERDAQKAQAPKPADPFDELAKLVDTGKITMLEYNARRSELLKAEQAQKAAAGGTPAPA